MSAGAPEAIIEVEVAKGRVDVIADQSIKGVSAEFVAFRITGGSVHLVLSIQAQFNFRVSFGSRLLIGRRRRRIVLGRHSRTYARTGGQKRGCGKEPHSGGSGEGGRTHH
jgi:hypothetical protein